MRITLILILVCFLNLIYALPSKDEFQVILHNPLLPYQQRLRLKLGSPFYEYMNFLKLNIPENSTIVIPPETSDWGMYGNFLYMQYWLFPRTITTDSAKADYALVIGPGQYLGFTKQHD